MIFTSLRVAALADNLVLVMPVMVEYPCEYPTCVARRSTLLARSYGRRSVMARGRYPLWNAVGGTLLGRNAVYSPCGAPSSSTRCGVVDEHCAPVDTLSAAPFAGAGAKTRSISVNTGAHDSDSAPSCARREPSQSRSEARRVRLARSSCAVATSRQAAQGYPANVGRDTRGGLLSVTFLGRARKVTSYRAAPGDLRELLLPKGVTHVLELQGYPCP